MGSTIVAQLVLLLGALVPAREDHCAYALSSRELQRKVGAARQAAISERFEARAQSAKAPTAVHGSPGAPLVYRTALRIRLYCTEYSVKYTLLYTACGGSICEK